MNKSISLCTKARIVSPQHLQKEAVFFWFINIRLPFTQFSRSVNFSLPSVFPLTNHGCSQHFISVFSRQEIGRLEENCSPISKWHGFPSCFSFQSRVNGILDDFLVCHWEFTENLWMIIRGGLWIFRFRVNLKKTNMCVCVCVCGAKVLTFVIDFYVISVNNAWDLERTLVGKHWVHGIEFLGKSQAFMASRGVIELSEGESNI